MRLVAGIVIAWIAVTALLLCLGGCLSVASEHEQYKSGEITELHQGQGRHTTTVTIHGTRYQVELGKDGRYHVVPTTQPSEAK